MNSNDRKVSANTRSSRSDRFGESQVRNSIPRSVTTTNTRSKDIVKRSSSSSARPRTTKAIKKYTVNRTPKSKSTSLSQKSRNRSQVNTSRTRTSSKVNRSRKRATVRS